MEPPSSQEEELEKKGKATEGLEDAATEQKPPPYGSKEYWDQRYEKLNCPSNNNTTTEDVTDGKGGAAGNNKKQDPDAFHSWYFSYDDLKPIILPLVLGGTDNVHRLFGSSEDSLEKDVTGETNGTGKCSTTKYQQESADETHNNEENDKDEEENDEDDLDNDEDEDGWEEASENSNAAADEGEEDVEEESQTEAGLAVEGHVAVLEVGCGDVPLVLGLAKDLDRLEATAAKLAVKRIVCTDYSSTLIDTLKRLHQKKRKLGHDSPDKGEESVATDADTVGADQKQFPIEYEVADARQLPFPDQSFHLIMEKGTMDAMISDPEVGVSNCIKIVSDCARVLAIGGCFFLVSHINAHTPKGEEWLDDVVVAGLRKGGGAEASWSIEVHGNDETGDFGDGDDDDDDIKEPPPSEGPAVYLIFKGTPQSKTEDTSDPPAIPLKFFGY